MTPSFWDWCNTREVKRRREVKALGTDTHLPKAASYAKVLRTWLCRLSLLEVELHLGPG